MAHFDNVKFKGQDTWWFRGAAFSQRCLGFDSTNWVLHYHLDGKSVERFLWWVLWSWIRLIGATAVALSVLTLVAVCAPGIMLTIIAIAIIGYVVNRVIQRFARKVGTKYL